MLMQTDCPIERNSRGRGNMLIEETILRQHYPAFQKYPEAQRPFATFARRMDLIHVSGITYFPPCSLSIMLLHHFLVKWYSVFSVDKSDRCVSISYWQ